MKVMKKRAAEKLLYRSLYLSRMKFDYGKYKWPGSQQKAIEMYGPEIEERASNRKHIVAVWFERRTDCGGPYCQIMCLTKMEDENDNKKIS